MFNPEEIIFAVTTACNLHCPHCFVNRNPFNLKAEDAVNFLKSVNDSPDSSIEKVGFSGGEPFLRPDFLCQVIKAAIDMDFMFDRIMTNGDWWKNEEDLRTTLQKVYDAGYDGKIGLSYDTFHAQSEERIASFIQTVWDIFGSDAVEIQSVKSEGESGSGTTQMLKSLAKKLNLSYEEEISKSGLGIATLSDGEHFLPAYIQTESYQAGDIRAWKDKSWFKDQHCAEMGQILFVHATGDIAPCCGFANENKPLFIGKITDTFDDVLKNAGQSRMIKICYEEGLSSQIKILKELGKLPEGKTCDICTFCDLLCKTEII
ncbi:4Fe-4S cluster-binding domain-containing protein [Treponema ruminis]|uniref:MoaA/NifB/PqqE/SkfB family radical SAM enzyme n=1 Tax=Treponema ruminis TaxID=744515 RepID=A0A7W8G9P7_9SPIR|nr:radical SAM protein [Treponema ruminis]MBB5226433.1 MoaA/NifB/PqqE/SkfB family radical SAM enzyme [Treponema ruminis]QSI02662.1 4Fe-4S cluster-binding domain-containing protein [Treponema ruminis]